MRFALSAPSLRFSTGVSKVLQPIGAGMTRAAQDAANLPKNLMSRGVGVGGGSSTKGSAGGKDDDLAESIQV